MRELALIKYRGIHKEEIRKQIVLKYEEDIKKYKILIKNKIKYLEVKKNYAINKTGIWVQMVLKIKIKKSLKKSNNK